MWQRDQDEESETEWLESTVERAHRVIAEIDSQARAALYNDDGQATGRTDGSLGPPGNGARLGDD